MTKIYTRTGIFLFLMFSVTLSFTQSITGKIVEEGSLLPLQGVMITYSQDVDPIYSDDDGRFSIKLTGISSGKLNFFLEGYLDKTVAFDLGDRDELDLGEISIESVGGFGDIDVITLNENEISEEDDNQDFSSVLTASRDIFLNTAAYTFSVARFRPRGYLNTHSSLYINGAPMNDLEDGGLNWSTWGGMNDVLRNRENITDLNAGDFSFGSLYGSSNIDISAANQRKQTRVSYASSNRSYLHRAMITHSTGWLKNDWAFSVSTSRRWGDEAYIEGTTYDAYAYFLGVDKKLGDHILSLNVFGAPYTRGRSTASVREMGIIADDNYYNPYWGYQEGEKRNAREYRSHQPIAIIKHAFDISDKTQLNTSVYGVFGKFGSSSLDWYNAPDPRPDYYRNLPSFYEDPELAQAVYDALALRKSRRQIDWDGMIEANTLTQDVVENVNGIEGNSVTGFLSNYIVQEQHYDNNKMGINSVISHQLTENIKLNGGLAHQIETVSNYKLIDDLLGGDFYFDIDKFAERDFPIGDDAIQNDLDNPSRLVTEGDVFGYNYDINDRKSSVWVQSQFSYPKLDFFVGASASHSQFWRTGYMRNGKFPENSLGDSEKHSFSNFGVKAGATYKINGRNYIYANGLFANRSPFSRNSFLSPRTRDEVIAGLQSEKIKSAELGYLLRYQSIKGRLTAYYSTLEDLTETISFYHDFERSFVNYAISNLDRRHQGIEFALEVKLNSTLTASGVASVGEYIYTDRPLATVTQDNIAETLTENQLIYAKNFKINGTPQSAFSLGLNYNSPHYWFANLNLNYFRDSYLDFNPIRRTEEAVQGILKDEFLTRWNSIIEQEKLEPQFTLDFFGGKSFKFNDYFLYLNLGVNNILNNREFITGGYEQLRYNFEDKDPETFPSRYFYAYGTNYYVSLSFRM